MKKYLGISLIIITGLILRLIFINKSDGLWNDEYISWQIASAPFFENFINSVKSQCHMPFYYLYLKFVMFLFGDSDLVLRLSSVFTGVLSIPVMYILGKENSQKTAYLCAGLTAISSFLIYYSQEVRFYSVLFLFSALCLIYTLRLIKNPSGKNLILCCIFNFLILFTHTIGFVYVFFNAILISVNLFKRYKKIVLGFWSVIFITSLITAPLALKIMTEKSFSQWWGHFSLSKIGFLFTDYFSPFLTNITNAPDNFLYMPKLAPVMLIPALIAIFGIIKACRKNRLNQSLLILAASTCLVLVGAAISGKLVFITKYSIEIYPILIYLTCAGISAIKNSILRKSLIILYTLISLGFIIIHPYSAPKMHRAEGHKIAADLLEKCQLKKDDIILLEYYPQNRYEKYFDFSNYRTIFIDKGNFPFFMSENTTYNDIYLNGKTLYRDYFIGKSNKNLEDFIKKYVFDNMTMNQSIVMVILDSVSFYSPEDLEKIAGDDALYSKEPLLFLVFSYIKNQTFVTLLKNLTIQRIDRRGSWTVIKFTKLNI